MKKTILLSAAVSGLILGATATTFSACSKEEAATNKELAALPRHACAKLNGCKGQGGCKTGDQGCKAKNTCKGKGGCAVPIKH